MSALESGSVDSLYAAAAADFTHYEIVKDLVDELIDLQLNYRQSGHPGGSRSKVHLLVATMLSGAVRWDIQRPWRPLRPLSWTHSSRGVRDSGGAERISAGSLRARP